MIRVYFETGECSNWDHAYESAWSYIDALIEEQMTWHS